MSLDRLIEEAMRAEAKQPAPPSAPRTRRTALWSALAVSLVALAAGWMVYERVGGPDERALEAGRRLALSIAAEAIRDFARKNGRYPARLDEAMPIALDIRYRRLEQGFELEAIAPDGRVMIVKER